MKRLVGLLVAVQIVSIAAIDQENVPSNVYGKATLSIENKSGEDYLIVGDFTEKAVLLKNQMSITLSFIETSKVGPVPKFIRPHDLVLYAQDSDMVENIIHMAKPNIHSLIPELTSYVRSHVYYVLESAGGLRRGTYTAAAGDRITLEKDGTGTVRGKSNFPTHVRFKKING
jgi:hypothetical protein